MCLKRYKIKMKTINSNHLEYINKELMNMDENTYSHFELYKWHNEYIEYRLFTEEDWKQLKYYNDKMKRGWDIFEGECPYDIVDISEFKWEHRYNTLNLHTPFGRNLLKISDIFWHTESNEEFKIKCDLNGIKEEDVNFYIVWNYNTPGYEFPFDWRIIKYDPNIGYTNSHTKFNRLMEMFEDITKNNKPMSTYEEFVSSELK